MGLNTNFVSRSIIFFKEINIRIVIMYIYIYNISKRYLEFSYRNMKVGSKLFVTQLLLYL